MARPTIDLGYPTKAQGDLPAFSSIDEEAAFWDTHDVTDLSELAGLDARPSEPETVAPLVVLLDQAEHEELDRRRSGRESNRPTGPALDP